MINCEQRSFNTWSLTEEGTAVLEHGSHEAVMFAAVDPKLGTLQADIMVCSSYYDVMCLTIKIFNLYRKLAPMLKLDLVKQCPMVG